MAPQQVKHGKTHQGNTGKEKTLEHKHDQISACNNCKITCNKKELLQITK